LSELVGIDRLLLKCYLDNILIDNDSRVALSRQTILPLFLVRLYHSESSISAAEEWHPAVFSCKNSKNSEPSLEEEGGEALVPAAIPASDFNPEMNFCCKFAADAAMADNRLNHLLRRRQLVTPSGWPSIAAIVMLLRYRNWRRAAA
jgi:hypothetical protein